ncbi:MAG: protein kinase [Acidobacteria bacterium]|nr:protein kinase [Acidobacteriota bacterium]
MIIGATVGPYQVLEKLGEGGMGEVYRARDTKLGREVALKVLPAALAGDPDRLARFRREAQVLAALNHPNIAQLYGFEDTGATHALVMELVEGATLADRIAQGPVPVDEALAIARQIAEALEAAHEHGIVHRDLKPANIKVREDGTVKVLDFGLARAVDPISTASGDAMNSPTLTAHATQLGMILGTAAYMAPEQAKGKPVDRRADIWAFGVVLFEMLTGQRAFKGEDVSDVLAAVLRQEIDWSALPAGTPPRIRRVLERCLERDPKRRLRDIGDVWIGLDAPADAPPAPAPALTAGRQPHGIARWLPWIAAVVIAAASVTWSIVRTPPPQPQLVTRSVSHLKDFSAFVNISRDGTKLVYTTASGGSSFLTLRMLDQFEGKPIPGTEGGLFPIFSPDGQWIAYSTASQPSKIRKIPLTGGTSIALCDGGVGNGATWGEDDTIVFSGGKGLMRVAASAGTPQPLTTVDAAKGEAAHIRPQFLPGGTRLLFTIMPIKSADGEQFAVLDLVKGGYRAVAKGGVNGQYTASGHLTYLRGSTLFAMPFDLGRLAVAGGEVPVIELVSTTGSTGTGDYSFSNAGLLAYVADESANRGTTLAWADRKGKTSILPGEAQKTWGTGRLSPNGRLVANRFSDDKGGADMWVLDVQRGIPTRLTFGGTHDFPVWTPDSRTVVFTGTQDGKQGLYSVPADASGKPALMLATESPAVPTSFTPDGKTLAYYQAGPDKRARILLARVGAIGQPVQPRPLHDASGAEYNAQISPDGRWVAFVSTESGTSEIYIQPFPGPGPKLRISTGGGNDPRWAQNGRELFYRTGVPAQTFMVVELLADSALPVGQPRELFQLTAGTTWDVTPDRDRFLVELTVGGRGSALALVTNWFEELRRRAPAKK